MLIGVEVEKALKTYIGNSVKMLSDDSTTSISAIASTFAARRRSGRIITVLPEASVGALATSDAKAMKTRRRRKSKQFRRENLARIRLQSAEYAN